MMNEFATHAPPPTGHGVYWAVNTNWRKPTLLGLAFVSLVFSLLLPWVLWETANQERAYAAAIAALDTDRFHPPSHRRDGELRSKAGQYHWRLVVWEQTDGKWRASLFYAHVNRHADYAIVRTDLTPYPDAETHGHRSPAAPPRPRP
jgi:hypothetical protein